MPHRIVIARPSVNMKALHRQRHRVSILPSKPELVRVDEASQPENKSLLDDFEQRLINVASNCRESGSFFSTSTIVLASSVLFSTVWLAKSVKRLHDICQPCHYPSLVLTLSSVVTVTTLIIHPITMFIASAAVGLAFKFWEPILQQTRRLSCTVHETFLHLERYLDKHSSFFEGVFERHVDVTIGILEQKTRGSDIPSDNSLLRRFIRHIPPGEQFIATSNREEDTKVQTDVELVHLASGSWIKMEECAEDKPQNPADHHLKPNDSIPYNGSNHSEQRSTFKIELKRSHANITRFDSEGWLLISNPDFAV